jgi:hypothetical protein
MVGLLIATAVLGQIVPIIDNWGHAGGAFMGMTIGFTHRILIRTAERPVAKWLGGLAVLLLIASAVAQVRENRAEASELALARSRLRAAELTLQSRLRTVELTLQTLQELKGFFHLAANRSEFERTPLIPEGSRHARSETLRQSPLRRPSFVKPLSLLDSSDEEFRAELRRQLQLLDACRGLLGTGPTATDFQRVRNLLARVLSQPRSERIVREFDARLDVLNRRAWLEGDIRRAEVESLRQSLPPVQPLNRRDRLSATRPAGAGDGPSAASAPR